LDGRGRYDGLDLRVRRNHPLAGGLRCVPLRHDDSSWPPSVTGPYPSTVSTLTGGWRRVRKSCIYGGDNEQCL
jgi:hypothetical protein